MKHLMETLSDQHYETLALLTFLVMLILGQYNHTASVVPD